MIELILGQQENIIDFGEVMETGEFVLVNLADQGDIFTARHAQVLGRLIVNDVVRKAAQRPVDTSPILAVG